MSTTAEQQYETHDDITVKSSNQYTQQVLGCFGLWKERSHNFLIHKLKKNS